MLAICPVVQNVGHDRSGFAHLARDRPRGEAVATDPERLGLERAADPDAALARAGHPGAYPLPQDLTLELRHRPDDSKDDAACRRSGVDPLEARDEGDADGPELLERRDEIRDLAAEAIEARNDVGVDVAAARRGTEAVELRPARERPRHAPVDGLLRDGPAARREVASKVDELELGVSVGRGKASVEGDARGVRRLSAAVAPGPPHDRPWGYNLQETGRLMGWEAKRSDCFRTSSGSRCRSGRQVVTMGEAAARPSG